MLTRQRVGAMLLVFATGAAVLLSRAHAFAQTGPLTDREFAAMIRACTDMMQQMIRIGGMMGMSGMMSGFGWWWPFQWLLVLALVAVIAIVLFRRPREGGEDALPLLKARLARGEITAQQYEETRRLLQG